MSQAPPTIAELGFQIRSGSATSFSLVEACLERAQAQDGLNAFVHLCSEDALNRAREADREISAGRVIGPLHGIPYAVKDTYDVAGLPTRAGSRLTDSAPARANAALVERLERAGAIILGKLNTWEYGTGNGGEYFDLPFPPARNPWDPARFTGGSSTGCGVAVAAGMVPFSLGSDTTGSIRLPAAATGTAGMIATPGALSLDGILPNCWSLDSPGILAWTAEDVSLVLQALTGGMKDDRKKPYSVGVLHGGDSGMPAPHPELQTAFAAAVDLLRAQDVQVTDIELPFSIDACFQATRMIGPAETGSLHEKELRERPGEMGRALRDKMLGGHTIRAVDYLAALRFRTVVQESIEALIAPFDAIVTYGTLGLPPVLGREPEMTRYTTDTFLTPFNLSGHPAMTQCIGFSADGLPLNWQIVGKRHDEPRMLGLAERYERATPWRMRRPGA
ncbi:amidase [Roseomonas marmotae]|uniref:Amidase n=1 Tax=Roseomonas marmotae TaxID=2768161 RepID=A0ABS3KB03_9PROT|nr:amidase [Roseomonas marmotae]MBO1074622.1 amidase [Roseomonas marmotae]QTI81645.1 amidase [Roseomonas marmotae]